MRRLFKTCLVLGLVALVASPVMAQRQRQPRPGQGGGRGGFGPEQLLVNKSVQEELKISDDQKKKAEDAGKKVQEMLNKKLEGVPRNERFQKMAEVRRELASDIKKSLEGILDTNQQKRFDQIQVQLQGTRAFSNEEIQKKLAFSDEQKNDIKTILDDSRKAMEEATKDIERTDFQKQREAREKVSKETMGKIAAKLSADQKKTWKDMTGEPFQIRFERPGGGGGTRPRVDL